MWKSCWSKTGHIIFFNSYNDDDDEDNDDEVCVSVCLRVYTCFHTNVYVCLVMLEETCVQCMQCVQLHTCHCMSLSQCIVPTCTHVNK